MEYAMASMRYTLHALVASVLATNMACAQEPRIVEPGVHLLANPVYPSGETWLGLFKEAGGFVLRPTVVSFAQVPHACGGTATDIHAADSAVPAFLLQGPGLRAGQVKSVWAQPEFLYPGQMRSFELVPNHWFVLYAYGAASPIQGNTLIQDYVLILSYREAHDTLDIPARFVLEATPHVVWAGDLDKDDRLDLIMALSTHYAGTRFGLFLSGGVQPPFLVTKRAAWEAGGC
jgi:hypothetical protein